MTDIILSTQNGEPVASSREIAKRFGKEHKHVLAAIRQILVAENSATKFFHETTFEYRGQKFPEYLMNRDAFSLPGFDEIMADALAGRSPAVQSERK
jgi:Rha family phage regulatory protein